MFFSQFGPGDRPAVNAGEVASEMAGRSPALICYQADNRFQTPMFRLSKVRNFQTHPLARQRTVSSGQINQCPLINELRSLSTGRRLASVAHPNYSLGVMNLKTKKLKHFFKLYFRLKMAFPASNPVRYGRRAPPRSPAPRILSSRFVLQFAIGALPA